VVEAREGEAGQRREEEDKQRRALRGVDRVGHGSAAQVLEKAPADVDGAQQVGPDVDGLVVQREDGDERVAQREADAVALADVGEPLPVGRVLDVADGWAAAAAVGLKGGLFGLEVGKKK